MIGLDTNVLVRYLAQDDAKQAVLATKLMDALTSAEPGFISQLVLVETLWVLESCYQADKDKIVQVVETLLRVAHLTVDQPEQVWCALRQFKQQGGDFADALIASVAQSIGCDKVFTFDKGAAKKFGMTLLK